MMTWEQAVLWLRQQESYRDLVFNGYLDDPLIEAARRFAASEEWGAVRTLLGSCPPARSPSDGALDIGAGRGIASYALAKDGWQVTALEPDPSPVVGAGAIRRLAAESALPISVVEGSAERLPVESGSLALVYGRQVFHHVTDLRLACAEAFRVLRPGGQFVMAREHVISTPGDLAAFQASHVTHQLCGGEMARLLADYTGALRGAGFRRVVTLGSWDSIINVYPAGEGDWQAACARLLFPCVGWRAGMWLASPKHAVGQMLRPLLAGIASRRDRRPGRLCSFVAWKPPA